MSEIPSKYHTTAGTSIQAACSVYETLSRGVTDQLGGFSDKVVLDLGVRFQFVYGGLNLSLAFVTVHGVW